MVNTRHGSFYGIAKIILGLAGQSDKHYYASKMKDSVFLSYLSKNEQKLI